MTKLAEYIGECSRYRIKVLAPDINESRMLFYPNGENIVFGLLALKNVGQQFIDGILRERATGGKFKDFENFITRMSHYDLNKRMIESLIKVGAFDSFGIYRSQLLASYESMMDTEQQKNRNNLTGQLDMFSMVMQTESVSPSFEYPSLPEVSAKEKLRMEKEVAGMCFSGNLLDSYSKHVDALDPRKISDLLDAESVSEKEAVKIAGVITSITVKQTKKNEKMAFFSLEDKYGEIECIAFPAQYERIVNIARADAAVYVEGNISLREDEDPKVLVRKVIALTENADYSSEPIAPIAPIAEKVEEEKSEIKSGIKSEAKSVGGKYLPNASKIYLRVPDLKSKKYLKAKNIVDIFEGEVAVFFFDESTGKYIPYERGMTVSEFIYNELCEILGGENAVLR